MEGGRLVISLMQVLVVAGDLRSVADDDEWTLAAGDWRCTVSHFGASLRRLWLAPESGSARDVLWGYSGASNKRGGQGDVLAPWPNRVRAGRYTFAGKTHQLPLNDKQGPNAIHGFLRNRVWEGQHTSSQASFRTTITRTDHEGYPFGIEIGVAYELLDTGLACAFVARNVGTEPAPFGIGFHPYVLGAVDAMRLDVPTATVVAMKDLLPTGATEPSRTLGLQDPLGAHPLNHCVTELTRDKHGFARIQANDVTLWMDRAFTHLVVYSGDALGPDARKALAIEPMTCGVDAFNQDPAGCTLHPGAVVHGTWGVSLG